MVVVGVSCGHLGASLGAILEPSWSFLGDSLGTLGANLEPLGAILGLIGAKSGGEAQQCH